MRRTFESLMTGAASVDLASAPRSISSSSVLTVSTSASSSPMASMSTSESPTDAMSSKRQRGPVHHFLEGRRVAELAERLADRTWTAAAAALAPSCLSCSDRVEP